MLRPPSLNHSSWLFDTQGGRNLVVGGYAATHSGKVSVCKGIAGAMNGENNSTTSVSASATSDSGHYAVHHLMWVPRYQTFCFSRGRDGAGTGWSWYLLASHQSGVQISCVTTSGGAFQRTAGYSKPGLIEPETWVLLSGVWSHANGIAAYVNGKLVCSTTFTATTWRNSTVGLEWGRLNASYILKHGLTWAGIQEVSPGLNQDHVARVWGEIRPQLPLGKNRSTAWFVPTTPLVGVASKKMSAGPRSVDISNPVSGHPLNRGLVTWWLGLPNNSGGGTLFDLCGKYPGTLTNGPTWSPGPHGFAGLTLDGSNDYVSTPSLSLGTVHTVSLWADYTDAGDGVLIGGVDSGGGNSHYAPYIDGPGGAGKVYYRPGLNGGSGTGFVSVAHGGITSGRWYHWAIARSGTSVAFYRDGVQLGATQTLAANGSLTLSALGAFSTGIVPATCRLADVYIVNRALSAAEVYALYEQSLRGHPDTLRRYSTAAWFVTTSNSFTSTSALSAIAATFASSNSHTGPAFASTASLNSEQALLEAISAQTGIEFDSVSGLISEVALFEAADAHTPPAFTSTADLAVEVALLSANLTAIAPEFASTADLSVEVSTLTSDLTHTTVAFTSTSDLSVEVALLSANLTHSTVTFTSTADLAVEVALLSANLTAVVPAFTSTAALAIEASTLASDLTHTTVAFTSTSEVISESALLSANAEFATILHQSSASFISDAAVLSANLTATTPTFTTAAALNGVAGSVASSLSHTTVAFTSTGAVEAQAQTTQASLIYEQLAFTSTGSLLSIASTVTAVSEASVPSFVTSSGVTSAAAVLNSALLHTTIAFTSTGAVSGEISLLTGSAEWQPIVFTSTADLDGQPPLVTADLAFTMPAFYVIGGFIAEAPVLFSLLPAILLPGIPLPWVGYTNLIVGWGTICEINPPLITVEWVGRTSQVITWKGPRRELKMKQHRHPVRIATPQRFEYTFRDTNNAVIDLSNYTRVNLLVKLTGDTVDSIVAEFNVQASGTVLYDGYSFTEPGIYSVQFLVADGSDITLYGEPIRITVVKNVDNLDADELPDY